MALQPEGKSRIWSDVDFDKNGKQISWLRLPYSSNISAYGWLPIPITIIKNGKGPTVLLTAGNHGDEYEGQVTLAKLIRAVQPSQVKGRLIIIPALNTPAALAGLRCSPIDDLNLNRSFPGNRDGSPTQMIAHYVESVLLPMSDYSIDLHSGGRTLMYIPSVLIRRTGDKKRDAKQLEILKAFGGPLGFIIAGPAENRGLGAAAERNGVISLGSELGGGGTVGVEALRVAERGVRNVLGLIGVMAPPKGKSAPTERITVVGGPDYYVYATERGLFEPYVDLGAMVKKNQLFGAIHFVDNPARAPVQVRFAHDGMLICKRFPGPTERGDCLAHLATDS
jgi:uncharacterized protein